MCGRIAQTETPEELAELLGVHTGLDQISDLRPSFNVPPSRMLPGLVTAPGGGLQWTALEWGMLPSWSKFKRPVINARCETAHAKPMFKHAFRSRRCVLPATAYYEWLSGPGGKQPYCIRMTTRIPLLLAGLHQGGQCVIMTREARPDIAHIHDRMPVALDRSMVELWLDQYDAAQAVFREADNMDLEFYPVTRRMGHFKFNDPSCLAPLSAQ